MGRKMHLWKKRASSRRDKDEPQEGKAELLYQENRWPKEEELSRRKSEALVSTRDFFCAGKRQNLLPMISDPFMIMDG